MDHWPFLAPMNINGARAATGSRTPGAYAGNLNGRSGAGGRNPHAYNGTVCVDKPSPSHKHESTAYGTSQNTCLGRQSREDEDPGGRPVDQICNPLLRGGSRERRKDQLAAVEGVGGSPLFVAPRSRGAEVVTAIDAGLWRIPPVLGGLLNALRHVAPLAAKSVDESDTPSYAPAFKEVAEASGRRTGACDHADADRKAGPY